MHTPGSFVDSPPTLRDSTSDRIRILFGLLASFFPAFLATFKLFNRDIGFHVATGRAIELLGRVPDKNVLSYTNPDSPWILHQWIPAWLFYRIDKSWGPEGLVLFKIAVAYITFVLIWAALARATRNFWVTSFWFILATSASFTRFYVRPFTLAMLFLAAFLLGLTWFQTDGKRVKDYSIFLAITIGSTVVCSAFHASFIYIWFITGAFFLAIWLEPLYQSSLLQFIRQVRRGEFVLRLAPLWVVTLVTLSVGTIWLLHPHPWEIVALPFSFSTNTYYHKHLVEYRPPMFNIQYFPGLWLTLFSAWIVVGWTLVRDFLKDRRLKMWHAAAFLTIAMFTHLVLKHQRMAYAFAMVTAFFAARPTAYLLSTLRHWPRRVAVVVMAIIALGTGGQSVRLWNSQANAGVGIDEKQYPTQMFQFIRDNDLPQRAYVSDSWAGWWLWEFYPERLSFYDNRLSAYPFEFYRDVYQAIRYGHRNWEELLDAYDVDMAVLKYTTTLEKDFLKGRPSIRQLMVKSPHWQLVYWDDFGQIFVRRTALTGNCIGCVDVKMYDPDTQQLTQPMSPETLVELDEVLRKSGTSARVLSTLVSMNLHLQNHQKALDWTLEGLERFPQNRQFHQARKFCNDILKKNRHPD